MAADVEVTLNHQPYLARPAGLAATLIQQYLADCKLWRDRIDQFLTKFGPNLVWIKGTVFRPEFHMTSRELPEGFRYLGNSRDVCIFAKKTSLGLALWKSWYALPKGLVTDLREVTHRIFDNGDTIDFFRLGLYVLRGEPPIYIVVGPKQFPPKADQGLTPIRWSEVVRTYEEDESGGQAQAYSYAMALL